MLAASARRLCAGALVTLVALTGCSGSGGQQAPKPKPTPLAQLNTTGVTVPRIAFCSVIPEGAVSDALHGKPTGASSWGNGDRATVAPGASDVVHELGCEWRGDHEQVLRAWVFARPVSEAFARTVVAARPSDRTCVAVSGPAFGDPSLTQVCRDAEGVTRVRHAGLLGQTWLSCELTDPRASADLRSRADAWCVRVVSALDTVG